MKKTMAWTVLAPPFDSPSCEVFWTRDEAIRFECWNLGLLSAPEDKTFPWSYFSSEEVSRAWRQCKRRYGCRAVRVLIEVHPKYLGEGT